jgi:hypothetical protein
VVVEESKSNNRSPAMPRESSAAVGAALGGTGERGVSKIATCPVATSTPAPGELVEFVSLTLALIIVVPTAPKGFQRAPIIGDL